MDMNFHENTADLPKIKEVLAEQLIEGTIIKPEDFTDQPIADAIINEETIEGDVSVIEVNEEGELIIKKEEENDNSVEENNPE